MIRLLLFFFAISLIFQRNSASDENYVLENYFYGTSFFDNFTFFTSDDYTQGTVDYVNRSRADSLGLISFPNGKVKISTDTNQTYPSPARGRPAIRIESVEKFNEGLVVFDFEHLPTGPGTWPAFWLYGTDWPNNGEFDILEGIDGLAFDSISGHTGKNCTFQESDDELFTGQWAKKLGGDGFALNCDSKTADSNDLSAMQGCSIHAQNGTFGPQFNAQNGGVYVMEWIRTSYARFWIFPRSSIPNDIIQGTPNPDTWGKPVALFKLGPNCTGDHFNNLTLTIDVTLCGVWAGNFYPGGLSACEQVVRYHPENYTEAYWLINYVKIYHQQSSSPSSTSAYNINFLLLILLIFGNFVQIKIKY